MATRVLDSVIHWRKKLDRDLDNDTILNVIHKLSKIPITLEILEVTHIGKTIRKLSKRDDIVGEKALAVLKKWRDAFASAEESVDRNSKPSSVSKKENIKKSKSPGNHDTSYEKSHHKERSNHAYSHKHEINSFSHSSSQQTTLTDVSKDSPKNNVNFTSPSIYTYTKKDIRAKYTDYDPHADASEGYNPECPELFPSEKFRKSKKEDLVEACELKPSLKHKVKSEEESGSLSKFKKIKTENSNVDCSDKKSKKSDDKTEKHCKKKSSIKIKSESESNEKQLNMKLLSDTKKSKNKKCDGNSSEKSNKSKAKVKINCSEAFTSEEVRFEDCLGFNDIVTLKKKKSSKPVQLTDKKVTSVKENKNSRKPTTSDHRVKTKNPEESSPSSKIKMHINVPKPTSVEKVDIFSTFPEPLPNYQPLPQRNLDFYSPKKKEVLTNEDAIRFTSSRREKTAVYSGRKSFFCRSPISF